MRDQELIGLYEAYRQVHGLNESTEELEYDTQYSYEDWTNQLVEEGYDLSNWTDEGLFEYYKQLCEENGVLGRLDTLARDTAGRVGEKIGERRGRAATGNLPVLGDIGATIGRNRGGERGRELYDKAKGTIGGLLNQSYEYDLYDTIIEYLISEGYADTNENALVIMANMSEDWKQSIVEEDEKLLRTRKRSIRGLNSKPISQYDPEEDKDNDYVPAVKPEDREGYYKEVPTDYRARKRRASGR